MPTASAFAAGDHQLDWNNAPKFHRRQLPPLGEIVSKKLIKVLFRLIYLSPKTDPDILLVFRESSNNNGRTGLGLAIPVNRTTTLGGRLFTGQEIKGKNGARFVLFHPIAGNKKPETDNGWKFLFFAILLRRQSKFPQKRAEDYTLGTQARHL